MRDVLYLAWRYLAYYRGKTAVLVGSISLILFLPAALHVVVGGAARLLTERAERTPLVLGARGSAVDLTLATLYFSEPGVAPIPHRELDGIAAEGLATVIPLHLRFTAGEARIVGTSSDYFAFRGLEVEEGRSFAILGEAVLGAGAASALGVGVGGTVTSTPAGAFDVAGSFPLRMSVVGVLAPTRTPDDDAIFVDLKTAWVIAGIGHGHDDVTAPDAAEEEILETRDDGVVVASPALLPFTEITPENLSTFHFHGDEGEFPVDAALVVPHDLRASTILQGRYLEGERSVQLVSPAQVVDELVETMFSVRDAVLFVALGLGAATVATSGLVFALSLRIRKREIEAIRKIGGSRDRLLAVLSTEVLGILVAAALIAATLTVLASRVGGRVLHLLTG